MIAIASFFQDPVFVLMAASFTLLIGTGVAQIDLVSRTEGLWRWVAAVPTMVIALYVVTNTGAPHSAWPEALAIWSGVAAASHGVVWFALRSVASRQAERPGARVDTGAHCADCASSD